MKPRGFTIEQLTKEGYRPVALLCLFDSNLLITPGVATDDNPSWREYPETTNQFCLDGAEIVRLAKVFGIDTQPLVIHGRSGKPDRYHRAEFIDFFPVRSVLDQQADAPNPIRRLFALEVGEILKLAAEHGGDGKWRESSYRGRYAVHWDFSQQEGVADE